MKQVFTIIIFLSIISCKKSNTNSYLYDKNQIHSKIDTLAHRYHQLNRFSGTILITKEDSLIFSNHYGLANYQDSIKFTKSTSFKVGDVSKLFTLKLVYDLEHKNQLKLSDSISKFLPLENYKAIIEDLLNSGIYSSNKNIEYNILGKVIEASTGKTLQEILRLW